MNNTNEMDDVRRYQIANVRCNSKQIYGELSPFFPVVVTRDIRQLENLRNFVVKTLRSFR